MKKQALALSICAVLLMNTAAFARQNETLPLYEDFSYATSSVTKHNEVGFAVSKNPGTAVFTATIEEGRLKFNLPAEGGNSITAKKTLNSVYGGSTFTFEMDFEITGSAHFYMFSGPVYFIDSAGTQTPLFKVTAASDRTYGADGAYNDNSNLFSGMNWTTDTPYKIKADVNLKDKTFDLYINGTRMQTASGDETFTYKGKDLAGFGFTFGGSNSSDVAYYIDNIKLEIPGNYYYVAKNGSNSNEGSEDAPFGTVGMAYSAAKSKLTIHNKDVLVKLGTGLYGFDNTYTLGVLDRNKNYSAVAFAPDNNANVDLYGDFNVDLPALDNFTNETLKQSFIEDISREYVRNYDSFPLELGDVNSTTSGSNTVTSVRVAASGKLAQRATLVTAVYNSGRLVSLVTDNATIEPGTSKELKTTVATGAEMKTFIWEDMTTMTPLLSLSAPVENTDPIVPEEPDVGEPPEGVEPPVDPGIPDQPVDPDNPDNPDDTEGFITSIRTTSITNVSAVVEGETVELSGNAPANSRVSVKITAADGAIIYIDQIKADENGSFVYTLKPSGLPEGQNTLAIASNGGVN